MSLAEEKLIDKIEVVMSGDSPVVQLREATRVLKDGEIIAQSYHRKVVSAGDDYSSEPANVQAICNAVFGA